MNKSICIFLISSPPSENFKSMEVYADALFRALEKIEGIKVSLHRWPQLKKTFLSRCRGFEVFKIYWMRFIVYPRQLDILPADVYHILDHSYAHLLKCLPTERTVITCHDLIPLILKEYKESLGGLFLSQTFKYSASHISKAKHVIVDSQATKEALLKFTSCPPEKITVIPFGVDDEFLEFGRSRQRKQVARDKTTNRILQIGATREPYKNTFNILKAFKILQDEYKENIQLLKIGAPYTAGQERFIRQSGLGEAIKYLGFLPRNELPKFYGDSDLLLMPSLDEGFSLPILEAMACGTPVVTSQRGAIPEVAGDAVYYVDPQDEKDISTGVKRLLLDSELTASLIERGLERAKQFSWEKTAQKTVEIYKKVAGL